MTISILEWLKVSKIDTRGSIVRLQPCYKQQKQMFVRKYRMGDHPDFFQIALGNKWITLRLNSLHYDYAFFTFLIIGKFIKTNHTYLWDSKK